MDKRDEGLVMGVGFWKTRNWEEEEEDECEMWKQARSTCIGQWCLWILTTESKNTDYYLPTTVLLETTTISLLFYPSSETHYNLPLCLWTFVVHILVWEEVMVSGEGWRKRGLLSHYFFGDNCYNSNKIPNLRYKSGAQTHLFKGQKGQYTTITQIKME